MWSFYLDRGGTFTDIVAKSPHGKLFASKVLNRFYEEKDTVLEGMERLIGLPLEQAVEVQAISSVYLGTTIVTNCILENLGNSTALLTTRGFKDALTIRYQNRPQLFALEVHPYKDLHDESFEITERIDASGKILCPMDEDEVKHVIEEIYRKGYRNLAICFLNSYANPQHELEAYEVATAYSFEQISVSSSISPEYGFISRAEATVLDAKSTPILRDYLSSLNETLPKSKIHVLKSDGNLASPKSFSGKDFLLSGPAGGVMGAKAVADLEGISRFISFDMGGTSTDISLYDQAFSSSEEKEIGGHHIKVPSIDIETIASGGGSIVSMKGKRLTVGPNSAGANPGPAAYRQGGPLTLTDCQVVLGRIIPKYFPKVFGETKNLSLDIVSSTRELEELTHEAASFAKRRISSVEIAEGAIQVGVEKMAHAIKRVCLRSSCPIDQFTLIAFGSASGGYICRVADALGIRQVCIPKQAGVLSAYGVGMAHEKHTKKYYLGKSFSELSNEEISDQFHAMDSDGSGKQAVLVRSKKHQKSFLFPWTTLDESLKHFQYSSSEANVKNISHDEVILDFLVVDFESQSSSPLDLKMEAPQLDRYKEQTEIEEIPMYLEGSWENVSVHYEESIELGKVIVGPAVIACETQTIVLEPGWVIERSANRNFVLKRSVPKEIAKNQFDWSPILLERFFILFQGVAAQMGEKLKQEAYSVNIKERQDYSCALFDIKGRLVASAPHIPVHLGSMGESVKSVIQKFQHEMKKGDLYLLNSPFEGGTHLPDITLIRPVFYEGLPHPVAYVAARGHHTEVGGISPGSMSATSSTLDEEGVLIAPCKIGENDTLDHKCISSLFQNHPFPSRNISLNLLDLEAQLQACLHGEAELSRAFQEFGAGVVSQYMEYILLCGQNEVEQLILTMQEGTSSIALDDETCITVTIKPQLSDRKLIIDSTGTSPQVDSNFNAPISVTKACVLYVLRMLVKREMPLNEGCLWAVELIVPKGSILNPKTSCAVAAGNVETSQVVVNALLEALKIQAHSQGTMNNISFGNAKYQYYETLCGGGGATKAGPGSTAMHSHMTNSRLTDPEVLEKNFPVRVKTFAIRKESGGEGAFPGGNGVVRELVFLDDFDLNIISNNRKHHPKGIMGGKDGKNGMQVLKRSDGTKESIPSCAALKVSTGDTLIIETPGGGGFGE